MVYEQLSQESETELRRDAEIDVLVRKIEALITGYDIDEMRMAVRVASRLPHFKRNGGEVVAESLSEQIRRELTDDLSR